jgi:hypothetical protein
VVFIYILLSFIFDIFYSSSFGRNYRSSLWAFTIVEYALLSYFLYLAFSSNIIKQIVKFLSIIVIAILLIVFVKSDKSNFDSFSASFESIIIIILSIIYFFERVNDDQNTFIFSSSYFWVVFGFLAYMSGTLFLFIMANQNVDKYWFINNIFNIITNLLFGIAFLICRFASKDPSYHKPSVDFTHFPDDR